MCNHWFRCCSIVLVLSSAACAQLNTFSSALNRLDNAGLSLGTDLYADTFVGRDAGRSVHNAPVFIDFTALLAMDHLSATLDGTTVYASVHVNQVAGAGFVTPIQAISGIEAESGVRLAEIWVEYRFRDGIHLRAGKIDANRDFAFIENGTSFLNATAGYTPAFVTLPNYNDSRPGMELLLNTQRSHLNLATFAPIEGTGALLIAEFGRRWQLHGWNGRVSAGVWHLTGKLPLFEAGVAARPEGAYVVGEQKLWVRRPKHGAEQSVSGYMQWGGTSDDIAVMPRQAAVGLVLSSPSSSRTADAVGVSCSRGLVMSPDNPIPRSHETAWELYYRVQATKNFTITPDLQYISESFPGSRSSFALGARLSMNLRKSSE